MQGNNLFEYAVVRFVPRPEREEFLNVGVILYCNAKNYLQMKYQINKNKIKAFYDKADVEELRNYLKGFEEVCCAKSDLSPIAKMDNASRFRFLTAKRSTILQTSQVHPGLCNDPSATLEKLFKELVEN